MAPGEGFEPPRADAQTLSCIRFRGVRLTRLGYPDKSILLHVLI